MNPSKSNCQSILRLTINPLFTN